MTLVEIVSEFNIILRKIKIGILDDMEYDAIGRSIEELLHDDSTPVTIKKQLYSFLEMLEYK